MKIGFTACILMIVRGSRRWSPTPSRRNQRSTGRSIASCFPPAKYAGSMRSGRWITPQTAPLCLSGINLDITARKRAEQALRESEERLRFCMRGAGAAAWQSDISTRQIVWSEECCELHGRDPKLGSPQYDDFLRCIHPEDRDRVERTNLDSLLGLCPKSRWTTAWSSRRAKFAGSKRGAK